MSILCPRCERIELTPGTHFKATRQDGTTLICWTCRGEEELLTLGKISTDPDAENYVPGIELRESNIKQVTGK